MKKELLPIVATLRFTNKAKGMKTKESRKPLDMREKGSLLSPDPPKEEVLKRERQVLHIYALLYTVHI